jgi:hypothetical protein
MLRPDETKFCCGASSIVSADVRWCERRAPVRCFETRRRLEGEGCGIPHLAKNERDMGHPEVGAGIEPKRATITILLQTLRRDQGTGQERQGLKRVCEYGKKNRRSLHSASLRSG